MEMDRPPSQKKKQINYKAGPNMEPTRQEKEGKTQSHLEKNHRTGDEDGRADMATTRLEGTRPKRMEGFHRWPMFPRELKGLTN